MAPADEASAAAALGAELRRLRRGQGLSQRELTRLIGLSAHSNLAEYESGRRIPPADIVSQCERALGVTDGSLQHLRSAALAERAEQQDPPASTENAGAESRDSPAEAPPAPAPTAGPPPERGFRLRRKHVLSPVGLAIISAVVVASAGLIAATGNGTPAPAPAPVKKTLIPAAISPNGTRLADNQDPAHAGCAVDAVDLESAPLRLTRPATVRKRLLPAGTIIGQITLRYSPACHAAWARLTPIQALIKPGLGTVAIYAERPADSKRLAYGARQVQEIYGNILLTAPGCVRAGGSITLASGEIVRAATACAAGQVSLTAAVT